MCIQLIYNFQGRHGPLKPWENVEAAKNEGPDLDIPGVGQVCAVQHAPAQTHARRGLGARCWHLPALSMMVPAGSARTAY